MIARPAWLLVALSLAALLSAGYTAWVQNSVTESGFPLDDAWIHLQFARNIAGGHGFSFNPDVPSAGSTAPLWTLVLALPIAVGLDPVTGSKTLGVILVIVTAFGAARLTIRACGSRWAGVVAGLAVALSARMTWAGLSGMEVPLYTALTTLCVLAYFDAVDGRPGAWWGLAAGLAGCARPETFVVGAVLCVHWWWSGAVDPSTGRRRDWWHGPAVLLAVLLAFVWLNVYVGGMPLPTTFYAKTHGAGTVVAWSEGRWLDGARDLIRYPLSFVNTLVLWTQGQSAILFLAALAGALQLTGQLGQREGRGRGVLVAVLLLSPLAKGLVAPEPPLLTHNGRYIAHLLVMFFVVSACGLAALHSLVRARWVIPTLALIAIARLGSQTVAQAPRLAAEVRNINDLQVRAGRWIGAHTSADARVATNDVGAIAFFSRRFVLDTEGLITPDAIAFRREQRLDGFLERTQPDLVVIFPEWYPYLSIRGDLLTEVGRFSAPKVIAGGETLVIYGTPWTRPGRLLAGTYSNR